mmetsp:Transcript_92785/g.290402  ORF Transcript_92785/g.290402 Transcript_92785/m.290402 type:complete len:420 (+) Transcript_92785:438-1697(+)
MVHRLRHLRAAVWRREERQAHGEGGAGRGLRVLAGLVLLLCDLRGRPLRARGHRGLRRLGPGFEERLRVVAQLLERVLRGRRRAHRALRPRLLPPGRRCLRAPAQPIAGPGGADLAQRQETARAAAARCAASTHALLRHHLHGPCHEPLQQGHGQLGQPHEPVIPNVCLSLHGGHWALHHHHREHAALLPAAVAPLVILLGHEPPLPAAEPGPPAPGVDEPLAALRPVLGDLGGGLDHPGIRRGPALPGPGHGAHRPLQPGLLHHPQHEPLAAAAPGAHRLRPPRGCDGLRPRGPRLRRRASRRGGPLHVLRPDQRPQPELLHPHVCGDGGAHDVRRAHPRVRQRARARGARPDGRAAPSRLALSGPHRAEGREHALPARAPAGAEGRLSGDRGRVEGRHLRPDRQRQVHVSQCPLPHS